VDGITLLHEEHVFDKLLRGLVYRANEKTTGCA